MRLAIISDTHDNISNFESALELIADADSILHCGDLCSPFMIEKLVSLIPGTTPVHVIWGNNEGDIRLICAKADAHDNIRLHGHFASLLFNGTRVALTHYPEVARPLAISGEYDLVCYGHDHTAHQEKIKNTVLLNPGELMGLKSTPTFAWYDTSTHDVNYVAVN